MAKRSEKSLVEQCEKVTIRFTRGQAEKIAEECLKAGIRPSQYLRIAGVAFTDHRYLDLKSMMQSVFDETIRLRRDFSDALVSGGD
ncbi:hypothetical protein [Posidoniimonas corsicana]|nr:hypothetical protein [Posidoniimonas corsicana]